MRVGAGQDFLMTAHCKMMGRWPLKQIVIMVSGACIKMVFWCVSGRKEKNGGLSLGTKRLLEDIPSLFKCLKVATKRRGMDSPQRYTGRGLKGRQLRGRVGFRVLLVMIVGHYLLSSTLIGKYYEGRSHLFNLCGL